MRKIAFSRISFKVIAFALMCIAIGLPLHSARAEDHFFDLAPAETPYLIYSEMNEWAQNMIQLQEATLITEEEALQDPSPAGRMLNLLSREFFIHLKEGTSQKLGLPELSQHRAGLYGLGLWPVFNVRVSNQGKFMKWIVRSAKKAGLTPTQSGKALIFEQQKKTRDPMQVVVASPSAGWVNIGFIPSVMSEQMLPYLTGTKRAETSMSGNNSFAVAAQRAKISSSVAAYISIERLMNTLLGQGEGLNQSFGWMDDRITKSVPQSCFGDYQEIAAAVPYLIMGQAVSSDPSRVGGRVVFKFSNELAAVTQTFSGTRSYVSPADGAQLQVDLNLNIKGIIAGLQGFLQAKSQTPFTCPHLLKAGADPQQLQLLSSQLMMIPPFVSDVKGVSITVKESMPVPTGSVILSADNVMNLINIAKSMKPELAQIKLPAVGAEPQVLEGLPLPPAMTPMVEITQNGLGLSIGSGLAGQVSQTLKAGASNNPPLLQLSLAYKELMTIFLAQMQQFQNRAAAFSESQYQMEVQRARNEGREPPPPPAKATNPFEKLGEIEIERIQLSVKLTGEGMELELMSQMPK